MEIAFALVIVVVAVVLAVMIPRTTKSIRQTRVGWQEEWRARDPETRRSIRETMHRGEPIEDPADGALVIRTVEALDRDRRTMRPIQFATIGLLVALLIEAVVTGSTPGVIISAAGLFMIMGLGAVSAVRARRLRAAAEATRRRHGL